MARILVVDDEPLILKVVGRQLARHGHEVVPAADGAEARARAAEGRFEVALVDKNLPDTNGLEVIRELRARDPEVQPIVMTGYPSTESAIEAIQLGASAYLTKPFGSER